MSGLSISSNTIELPSGRRVSFQYDIGDVLDFGEVVAVRLEVPAGQKMNRNVFGVCSETGRIVWHVVQRNLVYEDSPYTGMRRDGATLALFNWDGLELTVDPRTGDVLEENMGK